MRPFGSSGQEIVVSYTPRPRHGSLPVLPSSAGSNGPAIAQSCGSVTETADAPSRVNVQPVWKSATVRAAHAPAASAAASAKIDFYCSLMLFLL